MISPCTCGNEVPVMIHAYPLIAGDQRFVVSCSRCHRQGPEGHGMDEAELKWNREIRILSAVKDLGDSMISFEKHKSSKCPCNEELRILRGRVFWARTALEAWGRELHVNGIQGKPSGGENR